MPENRLAELKQRLQEITSLTSPALISLERQFSGILDMVNEKFRIEHEFPDSDPAGEQFSFIADAHLHFGEMLLGVYMFDLFAHLVDEIGWYVSVLTSRGLKQNYFESMIKAWIIAIHSKTIPRHARELVQPLELIQRFSKVFFTEKAGDVPPPPSDEVSHLTELLLSHDFYESSRYTVSSYDTGRTLEDIVSGLFIGTLGNIGRLWQENKIGVADEHIATSMLRWVLFSFCDHVQREPDRRRTVLLACVPGNEHELSTEMLARYLEIRGWRVLFIGHSTPERDLIRIVSREKPFAAALSIVLIAHLPAGMRLIRQLKKGVPRMKIMIGGRAALLVSKKLIEMVDATADAVVHDFKEAHELLLEWEGVE